jgi:hypothetical protein
MIAQAPVMSAAVRRARFGPMTVLPVVHGSIKSKRPMRDGKALDKNGQVH